MNRPILLVDQELRDDQRAYLETLESTNYYILGGTGAVSQTVEDQLSAYGSVERIKGAGRHETSVAIAEKFCNNADSAVLAFSQNFPDGLCAGPLASAMDAPLILTKTDDAAAAQSFCTSRDITNGYVIGGTGLISDEAVRTIFGVDPETEIIKK